MERPDLNEWAINFGHARLRRRSLLRRGVPQLADREAGAREPGPLEGDPEAELLVELWAMGVLPAVRIQTIAASSVLSAYRPQMDVLAGLGNGGRNPGVITRDLRRYLRLSQEHDS